jgi:hypothetical protein
MEKRRMRGAKSMQLLYFSPVPAASYCQRPHFFMDAARAFGVEKVLWVEPYPRRLPSWSDLRRIGRRRPLPAPAAGMTLLRVPALPIEPLPGGTALNRCLLWRGVWKELAGFVAGGPTVLAIGAPSRLALSALRRLPVAASFYDAMDDFPEFYRGLSRRAMRRTERRIAAAVDLVIASSTCLAEKFAGLGVPVETLRNACGIREFPPGRPWVDGARDRPARKVLGYVGCIADWFDWPLVIRLAQSVPDVDVELVGPCFTPPPRPLPPNIRVQAACDHRSLHAHMQRFTAGLIPFRINRVTASVDPIKYYDYRAFGLPVLSTNFGEMAYRQAGDGVFFLDRGADLRATVAAAVSQSIPWSATESFRRANNWEERFASAGMLRALLASPPPRAACHG